MEFDSLTQDTYDTVLDPHRWPGVLDRMAHDLNAFGCVVFEWRGNGAERSLSAPLFSSRFEREKLETYLQRCFEFEAADQDVFEAHSLKSDGIDLIGDEVICPSVAQLRKQKNVEILEKFGIRHRAAGLLDKSNILLSRFSVQLGTDRGRLTGAEHAYLNRILPHVAKALDLGRFATEVKQRHQSLLVAMDQLSVGICIFDNKGRKMAMNEEFRRQTETYRCYRFDPSGKIILAEGCDQRLFDQLRSHRAAHGQFGARPRKEAIASGADSFLCIEVTPLGRCDDMGSSVVDGYVLFSTDTSLPMHCDISPIQTAYHLTTAEAELLESISRGWTNAEIAQRRDRSVQTINAQVKSILSKTQCANRTQLVRLMSRFR